MCCFSQPVTSVSNTKIFARHSGVGGQFLVYQMDYESRVENAMILPLPVKQPASETSLKFIELRDYDAFFQDLDRGFPHYAPLSIGCAEQFGAKATGNLEVFEVGNYIASFVPTINDFDRLDPRFTLPKDTWEGIPGYESCGFAVFQLAAGSLKPHPMALEFQSVSDDLFFPTVHIHDGEVHESEVFDHVLYFQHAALDSRVYGYVNSHAEAKATGFVRSEHVASHYCKLDKSAGLIQGDLLVHRKILQGQFPNLDTFLTIAGDAFKPTLNIRPWLSYTPWLIVLAAFAWFANRRMRIKQA